MGWGGGVVAHVIIVSAPVQRIWFWGFLVLVRAFGSGLGDCWDGGLGLGLGLDNFPKNTFKYSKSNSQEGLQRDKTS